MAKTPKNSGKHWTDQHVKQLLQLARQNTPTNVIGLKLERTGGCLWRWSGENRNQRLRGHDGFCGA